MKQKLLVVELWGIGDLTLATTLLDRAGSEYEIHLLAKPHARDLLAVSYPGLVFHEWVAPWTVHRRKYRFWRWDWGGIVKLIGSLRRLGFAGAVSVRPDPRDHVLMWLSGARRRIGFPKTGSFIFLTDALTDSPYRRHRVECWRELGSAFLSIDMEGAEPRLSGARYRDQWIDNKLAGVAGPVMCLHAGAGAKVRRWPVSYWQQLVLLLRQNFTFHLAVIPDDDGFGAELRTLADSWFKDLSLEQLIYLSSRSDLYLCNDSGPMHIAAACGCPTIGVFGPGNPIWFRPWGAIHHMVIRDICRYRPCRDFCRFAEPYCLTNLSVKEVYQEISEFITNLHWPTVSRKNILQARSNGGPPVSDLRRFE